MPQTATANLGLQPSDPYGLGSSSGISGPSVIGATAPGTQSSGDSGLTNNSGQPTNDANAGTDAGTSSGMDWGQILNGLGNILGSPVVSSGALIGLGESAAAQQQSQTKGLTDQLTKPAQPFVQNATGELGQITGGPQVGGPLGQSIAQQTQTAGQFGDIAKQYSTGQLTTAQQQQVQQQTAAQKQAIRAQLAQQGITDSSVLSMYDQQIDNNTAIQTQQITQQNIGIAAQAQAAVQQTYSNLINDSIAQFGAGMGPIEDAINLTIQQNTQIAQGLQSLFGQIARGFMGATSGGQSPTAGIGQGLNQIGGQLGKMFNTGGLPNVPTSDINASTDLGDSLSGFTDATAGLGSDINSSVDLGDALSGFSSAGGQAAADAGAAASGGAADALVPSALGDYSFAPAISGASGVGDLSVTGEVSDALAGGASGSSAGAAGATAGLATGAALGAGALGAMAGLYELDQIAGQYTPKDQYNALANNSRMASKQSQQLQQDIASGKAVPDGNGGYTINGIPASVYYPLAGASAAQIAAANAPLAKNFLTDSGADWSAPAGKGGSNNRSVSKQ